MKNIIYKKIKKNKFYKTMKHIHYITICTVYLKKQYIVIYNIYIFLYLIINIIIYNNKYYIIINII